MENSKQRMAFFALFLLIFIDGLGQGLLFPILSSALLHTQSTELVPLHTSMEMRNVLYTVVIGIFWLCMFIGAPIISDLSDTWGRKKAMLLCLSGAVLGFLLSAIAFLVHSVWLLILGRVIGGFMAGSQPIAQAAVVDLSTPETQTHNTGVVLLSLSLGIVLGPVIGWFFADSHIVSWFTHTTPLYIATLLTALNLLFLMIFFKDTDFELRQEPINLWRCLNVFGDVFKHPTVRVLSLAFALMQTVWSIYYLYISVYLVHVFHFSTTDIGIFFGLLGVGMSIGFYRGAATAQYFKWSAKQAVIVGYSLIGLGSLFALLAPAIVTWILVIPAGFGVGLAYPNVMTLFSRQVDASRQGWVMGVTGAIMPLIAGIASMLSGWIASIDVMLPLVIAVIALVLGAIVTASFKSAQEV